MLLLIAQALYFFLPAYGANMAPVFARRWKFLEKPIHERYFGVNKTWRGIVVATFAGGIVFLIQQIFYKIGFDTVAFIDYGDFPFYFGFLMGFGAIMGDLVKSYQKRKEGIPPGEHWVPFDQIDFVIGALIGIWLVYVPPVEIALIILIVSPLLHLLVNYTGYILKIRSKKY